MIGNEYCLIIVPGARLVRYILPKILLQLHIQSWENKHNTNLALGPNYRTSICCFFKEWWGESQLYNYLKPSKPKFSTFPTHNLSTYFPSLSIFHYGTNENITANISSGLPITLPILSPNYSDTHKKVFLSLLRFNNESLIKQGFFIPIIFFYNI